MKLDRRARCRGSLPVGLGIHRRILAITNSNLAKKCFFANDRQATGVLYV
jgi:hypothetical protein